MTAEFEQRLAQWKENVEDLVSQQNSQTVAINGLMDLHDEEFRQTYLGHSRRAANSLLGSGLASQQIAGADSHHGRSDYPFTRSIRLLCVAPEAPPMILYSFIRQRHHSFGRKEHSRPSPAAKEPE